MDNWDELEGSGNIETGHIAVGLAVDSSRPDALGQLQVGLFNTVLVSAIAFGSKTSMGPEEITEKIVKPHLYMMSMAIRKNNDLVRIIEEFADLAKAGLTKPQRLIYDAFIRVMLDVDETDEEFEKWMDTAVEEL